MNARTTKGVAVLHERAGTGPVDTVRLLLKHGADLNAADLQGSTPLHYADPRTARALLDGGADPGRRNAAGRTPVLECFERWSRGPSAWEKLALKALEGFFLRGADPNAQDGEGRTLLHWAVLRSKKPDLPAFLLARGADPARADAGGQTPLHVWAAGAPRGSKAIQPLLDALGPRKGLDAPDGQGRTAAQLAVLAKAPARVKALVDAGALPP